MKKELANLDGLRTFAVCSVLLSHWITMISSIRTGENVVESFGYWGVMAFFVHTSLVLMLSLEQMYRRDPHLLATRFYIRRAFRLYPLALLCVATTLFLHIPHSPNINTSYTPFSAKTILANALLMQNLTEGGSVSGPLWSLPFEVDMYLMLPVLFMLASRPQGWKTILIAFSLFSGIGICVQVMTGHANLLAYIPCFLSGVLAYALRHKIRPRAPAWAWPIFVCAWFFVCWRLDHGLRMEQRFALQWMMCLILGLTISFFQDSINNSWNSFTAAVAMYSYGIYLSHVPTLWLVVRILGVTDPLKMTPLWLILTAAVSALAYHVLEAPMIGVGRRLTDGKA